VLTEKVTFINIDYKNSKF